MSAAAPGERRILVVEADAALRRELTDGLAGAGYRVTGACDGVDAFERIAREPPGLVLLGMPLPDVDAREVCRRLREWSAVPVVVLAAAHVGEEEIAILDDGADDYVARPFGWGELLARVRATLRRTSHLTPAPPRVRFGDVEVDLARRVVRRAGAPVRLTRTEYRLLRALARRPGTLVTTGALLEELWGPEARGRGHRLRFHLAALRRKLEDDPSRPRHLVTEPGAGCRLLREPR